MAEVTLYGHWICPFVLRVKFSLAYKGIDFDEIEVPPSAVRPKGFQLPPEFVEHSPNNEVPMIRHGETHLPDSIPILVYLEEHFSEKPLLPKDEARRDEVLQRTRWLNNEVMTNVILVYYGLQPDWVKTGSEKLVKRFGELEEDLKGSPWLAGDAPTLAECVMQPIWGRLNAMDRLGFEWPGLSAYPRLADYIDRCRALPGYDGIAWSAEREDEMVGRFKKARSLVKPAPSDA